MKGMALRIRAALARDLRIQYRERYLVAALAGPAAWGLALRSIQPASGHVMAPAFLFLDAFLVAFSLGVHQAARERNTGVLSALDLTPLRPHEFLAARCASLGMLAAVPIPILAVIGGKPVESWVSLMAGAAGEAVILSLAAFLVVAHAPAGGLAFARFLASMLLLVPPLLPFLGSAPGPWLIAHPLQGPLLLLQGAYFPLPGGTLASALAGLAFWTAGLLLACRSGFERLRRIPAYAPDAKG